MAASEKLLSSAYEVGTRNSRRCETRVRCGIRICVFPGLASPDTFIDAYLSDCSASGLGLLVKMPMQPSQLFVARVLLRGQNMLLIYEVRHCEPAGAGTWKVGARFTGFSATPFQSDRASLVSAFVAQCGN